MKEIECTGCHGKGTYYDYQWGNKELCDWCLGKGVLDYLAGPRYIPKPKFKAIPIR